jgi:hypothetical protein
MMVVFSFNLTPFYFTPIVTHLMPCCLTTSRRDTIDSKFSTKIRFQAFCKLLPLSISVNLLTYVTEAIKTIWCIQHAHTHINGARYGVQGSYPLLLWEPAAENAIVSNADVYMKWTRKYKGPRIPEFRFAINEDPVMLEVPFRLLISTSAAPK